MEITLTLDKRVLICYTIGNELAKVYCVNCGAMVGKDIVKSETPCPKCKTIHRIERKPT